MYFSLVSEFSFDSLFFLYFICDFTVNPVEFDYFSLQSLLLKILNYLFLISVARSMWSEWIRFFILLQFTIGSIGKICLSVNPDLGMYGEMWFLRLLFVSWSTHEDMAHLQPLTLGDRFAFKHFPFKHTEKFHGCRSWTLSP